MQQAFYFDSWLLFKIFLILSVIYWYLSRNFNYWSKRGVKGPRPLIAFGNIIEQRIRYRPQLEVAWFRQYGKIYGIFAGNRPVLRVSDPELVKQILVKDFHILPDKQSLFVSANFSSHPILKNQLLSYKIEDWKRIRSIISPSFTSGKLKKTHPMIKDCLSDLLDTLEVIADTPGGKADMKQLYGNYSMDVIARYAFATKTTAHKQQNNPFFEIFNPKWWRLMAFIFLPESLLKSLKLYSAVEPSAIDFFINLTKHIIGERLKNSDQKHHDFIDLLLNAQKNINTNNYDENSIDVENGDVVNDVNNLHDHVNEKPSGLNGSVVDKYMTENEILSMALVFFIAGYEPTSTTLTFTLYELALNQDIQQRLYEEVLTAVDANDNIDYGLLSKLPYLDSVISESLRMHPPDYTLARKAIQDYKLGSTGIKIYKGQSVEIPIYAMHLCEEYFPEPFVFNPERFMPENRHKIIPYTYLPFGAGPRNCVGTRLAIIEVKLGVAEVIRRFKISKISETEVPILLSKGSHFQSPKRSIVGVQKR